MAQKKQGQGYFGRLLENIKYDLFLNDENPSFVAGLGVAAALVVPALVLGSGATQQTQTTPVQTVLQNPGVGVYGFVHSVQEHSFGARSGGPPILGFPFTYQIVRVEAEGGPRDVLIPYPSSYQKGDIFDGNCNLLPQGKISLEDIASLSNADSLQRGKVGAFCLVPPSQ